MKHLPRTSRLLEEMQAMPYNLAVRLLAVTFICALVLAWSLIHRDAVAAGMVVALLVLPVACLLRNEPRVNVLGALCGVLVALPVAGGYAVDLFWWVRPYDAWAHALVTFSVSLAFSVLCRGALPQRSIIALAASLLALGVGVGVLWEAFEWYRGRGYGLHEAMSDLTMDSIGALIAAFLWRW